MVKKLHHMVWTVRKWKVLHFAFGNTVKGIFKMVLNFILSFQFAEFEFKFFQQFMLTKMPLRYYYSRNLVNKGPIVWTFFLQICKRMKVFPRTEKQDLRQKVPYILNFCFVSSDKRQQSV